MTEEPGFHFSEKSISRNVAAMHNRLPPKLSWWPEDYDPWRFGDMLPDDESNRKFGMSGWQELRRQLSLFMFHVLNPDDYPQLSIAEQPDEDTEKRCDEWIRQFVTAADRTNMFPPPDLRKWVAVRCRLAMISMDVQLMRVELGRESIPEPDMHGNFAGAVLSQLIDFWYEEGKKFWLKNPNRTANEEGSSLTWYWKQTGLTLKPATTWPEVLKLADEVLKDLYRNVRFRCPTGEDCSDVHERLSQGCLMTAIFVNERSAFKPEREIAKWIAARLETAKLLIKGYIGNPAKAPLPEGNTQQALYVLAITRWEDILAPLWAGFSYKKGKLVWDATKIKPPKS